MMIFADRLSHRLKQENVGKANLQKYILNKRQNTNKNNSIASISTEINANNKINSVSQDKFSSLSDDDGNNNTETDCEQTIPKPPPIIIPNVSDDLYIII